MKNIIIKIIRILLIVLFTYTVIHKILDLKLFSSTLMKSTIIQENQVEFILYLIPFLEIITIFALLFEKRIEGFYLSFILMLIFSIYLIALNNFSLYKGCSCGGIFNELTYMQHIIVNIFYIGISLIAIILFEKK